jgi:fido (protein-threonine AMPylation protein)
VQIGELKGRGVLTLAALAQLPLPLSWKPDRGVAASYERIREQARIQVQGRAPGKPLYETLPVSKDLGLSGLPAPSPGDVFFDLEGDPFIDEGGLEYLFGYAYEGDGIQYRGDWAVSREGERQAFMFAAATQVPRLMQDFERGPLREFTPCSFDTVPAQATALAIVHAEFILIHPFRDGNGRCARLLAMLMGLQAGLPALDFGGIRGAKKREYIAAVQAALSRDYDPMTKIFREVIARTLKSVAKTSSV